MGPTDSYIAKDLVNLLRYVSGISTHFPKSVLSELKTFISINKIKATDSNKTLPSETRANCELTQVTADRTRTTGHIPRHNTGQMDTDIISVHPLNPRVDTNYPSMYISDSNSDHSVSTDSEQSFSPSPRNSASVSDINLQDIT